MKLYATLLASTATFLVISAAGTVQAQGSCCANPQCPMTGSAPPAAQQVQAANRAMPGMPMMSDTNSSVDTSMMSGMSGSQAGEGQVQSSTLQSKDGQQVQEVKLEVTGSYNPSVLKVKKGIPVVLKAHRKDANNCGGELLIPEFGVKAQLPPGEITEIKFTPTKEGTFAFTCGMNMMRGQLVVDGNGGK